MGKAVSASKKGLDLEVVWDNHQAKGSDNTNKMSVVKPASLKESIKGEKSIIVLYSQNV